MPRAEEPPSPEALFQAHRAWIGGDEALRARGPWSATGEATFEPQGLTTTFTESHAVDRYWFHMPLPGGAELSSGYDGEVGWAISPGERLTGGAELEGQRHRADLYDDPERWVVEARTVERTTFNDEEVWEVALTWTGGREGRAWYRTDGRLLARSEMPDTGGSPTLTLFNDYQDIFGVQTPTRVSSITDDLTIDYQLTLWAQGPDEDTFSPPELRVDAPVAEVPMAHTESGHLLIPLVFEETIGWFLLDTGANTTLIDAGLAARLGLTGEGLDLSGETAGGSLDGMRLRKLPGFAIGERAYESYGALEVDLSSVGVDGVLSNDFLSLHVLEVDPEASAVRLHPRGAPPAVTGLSAIPLTWFADGLLRTELRLEDGQPFPALVDLGAVVTVLSRRATFNAAARPGFSGFEVGGALTGAEGEPIPVQSARFESLTAGPIRVSSPELLVGELPGLLNLFGPGASAILGIDQLGDRRLVIDPAGPTLYLGDTLPP